MKVATRPLNASVSLESIRRICDPSIQRPVQQPPSLVPPSTIETPPLFPLAPSLNGPTPAPVSGKPGVAPLHGFVQELIHRSRSSGVVLEAALCYIEAVRRRLPKITSVPVTPLKETKFEERSQSEGRPTPELPIPSPLLCPCRTFPVSAVMTLLTSLAVTRPKLLTASCPTPLPSQPSGAVSTTSSISSARSVPLCTGMSVRVWRRVSF